MYVHINLYVHIHMHIHTYTCTYMYTYTYIREVHLGILNRPEFVPRLNHFVDPRIPKRSMDYIKKVAFAANLKSLKIGVFEGVRMSF